MLLGAIKVLNRSAAVVRTIHPVTARLSQSLQTCQSFPPGAPFPRENGGLAVQFHLASKLQ